MNTENFIADELEADILRAITVIKEDKQVSAGHFQRRLKLSYGQAVKIIARLENQGIIGPVQGRQPRVIFFDKIKVAEANPISSSDANLVGGWRNEDATQQERSETSTTAETKRVAPDAIAAVEKGSQSIAGSSPAPPTISESQGSITGITPPVPPDYVRAVKRIDAGSIPALGATLRLGILAYLPPVRFHTAAFLENLKRNPPAHELVTFSDDPSFNPTVKMKRSIEIPSLKEKQHGVANLAFYLAFGQAWKRDFTHFLYAEADIRVRNVPIQYTTKITEVTPWDAVLLHHFKIAQEERAVPLILGGSMLLHNPFKPDPETAQRATELLAKWNPKLTSGDVKERNREVPVYGARKQPKEDGSGVGCNGAGAIYSVEGLRTLFPEIKEPGDTATMVGLAGGWPFDFECARRNWRTHKAGAFDRVAHLPCIFSSFGDTLSTESERLEMLRSGQRVLIHSCKSATIE